MHRVRTLIALALAAPAAVAQGPLTTEEVLPAGLVSRAVFVTSEPEYASRLYVVSQDATIHLLEDGALLPTPFVDLSAVATVGGFSGLRGMCFHPEFASNRELFVVYDAPDAFANLVAVLARLEASAADPNVADLGTLTELLRIPQGAAGHGGGALDFGPDGYLHFAIGDGGIQEDPDCNAQNGQELLGKVLRLDVDSAFPYAIPPDNPFVGDPAVLDEIWHLGLRNPWRTSFDRLTGDYFVADVGQWSREEISFAPAGVGGLNFGWKVEEGASCFSTTFCGVVAPCGATGYVEPIHDYGHGPDCSVTGGYVYRGPAIQWLQGTYFYGDFCSGRVFSFRTDGVTLFEHTERTSELSGNFPGLTSFGQDAAGELYLVQHSGRVTRLVADSPGTNFCFGDGGDQLGCTPCACGNEAPSGTRGGCLNAAGSSAQLLASGVPSALADGLRFEVTGANPTTFGVLASADERLPSNPANACFGTDSGVVSLLLDGLRCIGGGLQRHGARATDAQGAIGLGNNGWGAPSGPPGGLVAQGGFSAGQTRQFTVFYREDPLAQCGTGQNTTNGVELVVQP